MLCSFNIFYITSCLSLLFSTFDGLSLFSFTTTSALFSSRFPLFEIFLVLLYYSRDYHLWICTYLFQTAVCNVSKSLRVFDDN